MKRVGGLWDKLISFENLHEALLPHILIGMERCCVPVW